MRLVIYGSGGLGREILAFLRAGDFGQVARMMFAGLVFGGLDLGGLDLGGPLFGGLLFEVQVFKPQYNSDNAANNE